ncbi:MAG: hypothetical protein SFV15_19530 [Polyangiaceae bacterium]|nr:hypothetical protein [Polyangiaceae bacterium]
MAMCTDSACYHSTVIKWLANAERANGPQGPIGFTISADMTTELRALAAAVPEADWAFVEERSDAIVSAAEVEFTPGNWPKPRSLCVRYWCASKSAKANSFRPAPTHASSQ